MAAAMGISIQFNLLHSPPHKLQRQQCELGGLPGIFTWEKTRPSSQSHGRGHSCAGVLLSPPLYFSLPFCSQQQLRVQRAHPQASQAQHHHTGHSPGFWATLQSYWGCATYTRLNPSLNSCSSPSRGREQPMDKIHRVSQKQRSSIASKHGIQKCNISSGIKGYDKSDYSYLF